MRRARIKLAAQQTCRAANLPRSKRAAAGLAAQRETELVELRLDLVERGLTEVRA
ncbi:MAG: hypothetical protein ACI8UD_003258, partial [Planctomycetota bacterium]